VTLEIDAGTGPMPVYIWEPPSGTGPGILLLQEIFGVSDYIQHRAADLAALGCYVAAVSEPDHAFDNPLPAFQHAKASALAWQRSTEFLSRHLPTDRGHQ